MPFQCLDQRTQQGKDLANPVGQGRALQHDAGPGIDLALTIEWQVVTEFRSQNMGQQCSAGPTAADW